MSAVQLGLLLRGISSLDPRADATLPPESIPVTGIEHDHRRVQPGSIFVCLRGLAFDGHAYAREALERGAVLLVGEEALPLSSYVRVVDSRRALALLSCVFYGHPSRSLRLIGVTGTNGKTSVTWMLERILSEAGLSAAVLGTLGSGTPAASSEPLSSGAADRGPLDRSPLPASAHTGSRAVPFRNLGFTTPEANALQQELARWVGGGIQAGAMEVSSHALALSRSFGIRFAAGIFTNLTRDHLDFHHTMESYRGAKNRLFRRSERGPDEPPGLAVVNGDDPAVSEILEGTEDAVIRFGRGEDCDVRVADLVMSPDGIRMRVAFGKSVARGSSLPSAPLLAVGNAAPSGTARREALPTTFPDAGIQEIASPLLGEFQVENLLAAFAAAVGLGIDSRTAAAGLERLRGIPGRMEKVDRGQPFSVVVDYAHTPDALRRALVSLRPFTPGALTVVFGCGGDRDRSKRAPMGRVAAEGADRVILTDDNPRSEDPAQIRAAIRVGLEAAGSEYLEVGDRAAAIRQALTRARPGDTVLLAGKGHESVQLRGNDAIPFDDRVVAGSILDEILTEERP